MKKIVQVCLFLLFSVSIGSSWVSAKDSPKKLDRMNRSERNYQVLNQFISDYGKGTPGTNKYPQGKPAFFSGQTENNFQLYHLACGFQL